MYAAMLVTDVMSLTSFFQKSKLDTKPLSSSSTTTDIEISKSAKELKSIFIEQQQQDRKSYTTPFSSSTIDRFQVDELMETLEKANVKFDPEECINGPLFCVVYQKGPQPFWEKYDIGGKITNRRSIKGQKYTKIGNSGTFNVVNYAEFIGSMFSIKAFGTFRESKIQVGKEDMAEEQEQEPMNKNFLSEFSPFIFGKDVNNSNNNREEKSCLTECPVDFQGIVNKGRISILGKDIDFSIPEGKGYLRVLYADPEMRIFISPKSTSDKRWEEKAGLTVIQMRADLVTDDGFDIAED